MALSGGGARGLAHIGALKVLEREGIPIHFLLAFCDSNKDCQRQTIGTRSSHCTKHIPLSIPSSTTIMHEITKSELSRHLRTKPL